MNGNVRISKWGAANGRVKVCAFIFRSFIARQINLNSNLNDQMQL